jgi:hypothetical protein
VCGREIVAKKAYIPSSGAFKGIGYESGDRVGAFDEKKQK